MSQDSNSEVQNKKENEEINLTILDHENFIESAYNDVKVKLIKDIILKDLKSDLSPIISHAVQDHFSSVNARERKKDPETSDPSLIGYLKNEVEFLKSELVAKNKLLLRLLDSFRFMKPHESTPIPLDNDVFSYDDIPTETSKSTDSDSASSTSSVISIDNNSHIDIENQLNDIRTKKHHEFLYLKKQEKEKVDNKERSKSNAHIVKNSSALKNQQGPHKCFIVGDSIISGIDEKKLERNNFTVKVECVPGAKTMNLKDNILSIIEKSPDLLIVHSGTNDAVHKTSRDILTDLLHLKYLVLSKLPNGKVVISNPTLRSDQSKAAITLHHLNQHLSELNIDIIDNKNIGDKHLGKKGLHLNRKGTGRLAINFINVIRKY